MITNNMTVPSHDRSKNILLLFACTCILLAPSWAIRILFSNGTTRHKKLLFQAQQIVLKTSLTHKYSDVW